MLIYNDTFKWDGSRTSSKTTICWWPGSYNLKIIDVSLITENVHMLKPYICIFSNTGDGISIGSYNHTQNFLKRVCEEFGLKIDKTMFIEHFSDKNKFEVVHIKRTINIGIDTIYSIQRRTLMNNEFDFLKTNYLIS